MFNERIRANVAGALRRGTVWIVLFAMALVTASVLLVTEAKPSKSVASATVAIPTGASADNPGNAVQAGELARAYTLLIPADDALMDAVISRTGVTRADLDSHLTVATVDDSSVLTVSFDDPNRERALAVTRAVYDVLVDPTPAGEAIAAGSIQAVRAPDVTTSGGGGTGAAIPIGLFLGLCLGIALAVGWERADPCVDHESQLAEELGAPATRLGHLNPSAAAAVLERWRRLAGGSPDGEGAAPRVGLLAGTPASEAVVEPLAQHLVALGAATGLKIHVRDVRDSSPTPSGAYLELVLGGAPGTERAGEAVVSASSLIVLAVRRGSQASKLRAAESLLAQFGGRPSWALLVAPRDLRAPVPGAQQPVTAGV